MTAVQSILLYRSEVWVDELRKELYRRRLAQVQRRAGLQVFSAYRTVSEPAILVGAGMIPVTLALERKRVYTGKRETGEDTSSREASRALAA